MINQNHKTPKLTVGALVGIITVVFLASVTSISATTNNETETQTFPCRDATVVYNVEGTSPLGQLVGTATYKVVEVNENSYTVSVNNTGNLNRLPAFGETQTKTLSLDQPISFASVIQEASIVGEKAFKINGREIKISKYHLETEKEYGTETISVFMPKKLKVPLIVYYKYGDKFRIHIELAKTNIDYLR